MVAIESVEDRLSTLRSKLRLAKAKHDANSIDCRKRAFCDEAGDDGLNDTTFLEIFAGEAGLTGAVRRLGIVALEAVDIHACNSNDLQFDLTRNEPFKKLKKLIKTKRVRWLHLAPPCKTFSRARRRDRWAKVRKLRSHAKPEGLEPRSRLVKEANLLASRSAQLARLQHKVKGWFSIENPEKSFIWIYKPLALLRRLDGVRFLVGDQCMFGGEYRKPTGWLTNAPHLQCLEKRCPGGPGHEHPALVGLAEDFEGKVVWKTSLAAEYPEGLCNTLAVEYQNCLQKFGVRQAMEEVLTKEGDKQNRPDSQVWLREVENAECIGGMRNPTLSVLRVPGLRGVGANLFWFLDQLQFEYKRLNELVKHVGGNRNSVLEPLTKHLQTEFAKYMCIPWPERSCGLWAELFMKLVDLAGDPDREAATWPKVGTPLGICERIPSGGVFPQVDHKQFLTEQNRLEAIAGLVGSEGNYISYDENKADADELFIKEMENGYVDWSTDQGSLEKKYGPLVQSSIGVIVKYKKDVKKVRLVHDLRRSGINNTIQFGERLVLPRLRDVVEDAMILFEALEPGEKVMLLSLDFRDAFKQLPVRDNEKRFLSGMAAGGYFVYHVVLFGVRTGPLVWARLAAMVSRFTQSMFAHDRCRLQVYVDDPLILMRGKPSQIEDICNKILCLWVAMGLKISWSKGTLGEAVEWIGAQLELDNSQKLIRLTVTSEKLEEWKALLSRLDTKPMVSRKLLTQFTGKMSWAAGFLIQLRPFVRMLHTALSVQSKVSDKGAVYHRQVAPAIQWFQHLFSDLKGSLRWEVRAHLRQQCALHLVVDASPWGGGALLYENNRPAQTLSLIWNEDDEKNTGAKIGDPASQALWEGFMVLRALWCWLKPNRQGFVRVVGDAEGVLSALLKRSAKAPLLNAVVREISLLLARNFQALETVHVWSEYNEWADALSRIKDPNKPAVYPRELQHCIHVEDAPQYWHGPLGK